MTVEGIKIASFAHWPIRGSAVIFVVPHKDEHGCDGKLEDLQKVDYEICNWVDSTSVNA